MAPANHLIATIGVLTAISMLAHKYPEYQGTVTMSLIETNNATVITQAAIVDGSNNIWTLVQSTSKGLQIVKNGIVDTTTANVTKLIYENHMVYQQNLAGGWWYYAGNGWQATSNPIPTATPTPTPTVTPTPTPTVTVTPTPTPTPTTSGGFHVSNGKIIAPDGSVFVAKGINVADWAAVGPGAVGSGSNGTNNGTFMLTLFPGINFVRLNMQGLSAVGNPIVSGGLVSNNGVATGGTTSVLTADSSGYACDPANLTQFIQNVTGYNTAGTSVSTHHVVVEIEDHCTTAASSTIAPSAAQEAWYANCAKYYKNNPYVWFGSTNEPLPDATTLSSQTAEYNAVRKTGNNNPFLCAIMSGWYATYTGAGSLSNYIGSGAQSIYGAMTNIIWDLHAYSWMFNGTNNTVSQATANAFYASQISFMAGQATSANGAIPIIWGEFGTSSNGSTKDASGTQNVIAAQTSIQSGAVAWDFQAGTSDLLQTSGRLTSFGTEVAGWMATNTIPASWTDSDNS